MSRSLYWPTGEWSQILGQLAEGPKVSQSWYWPAGEQARAQPCGAGPLAGCGAVVVLGLVSDSGG